jgi:hypothetical protein
MMIITLHDILQNLCTDDCQGSDSRHYTDVRETNLEMNVSMLSLTIHNCLVHEQAPPFHCHNVACQWKNLDVNQCSICP